MCALGKVFAMTSCSVDSLDVFRSTSFEPTTGLTQNRAAPKINCITLLRYIMQGIPSSKCGIPTTWTILGTCHSCTTCAWINKQFREPYVAVALNCICSLEWLPPRKKESKLTRLIPMGVASKPSSSSGGKTKHIGVIDPQMSRLLKVHRIQETIRYYKHTCIRIRLYESSNFTRAFGHVGLLQSCPLSWRLDGYVCLIPPQKNK